MTNMRADLQMLGELEVHQLQRLANTERLEGNYVAAQRTEKLISRLKRNPAPPAGFSAPRP